MTNTEKLEEKEIDFIELAKKIWEKRLTIVRFSVVGFVLGIIVAFSIPKEYVTNIVLAPDSSSEKSSGGMNALAAVAGINVNSGAIDVFPPELFPNIMESTPFILGLFDVRVEDKKNGIDTTFYSYLENDLKSAWWTNLISLPSKGLGLLFGSKETFPVSVEEQSSDLIFLTKEQAFVCELVKSRVTVNIDKKSGVITLTSEMQSPEISAYLADTVVAYLQSYVINYRTEKARKDLAFAEKLFKEAQANYYEAQQAYALFLDENMNVTSARYRTTQETLQNEMSLTFGVYNQMAQQLQMAKVKVQDTTPVYSIIQPAVVPTEASGPKKKLIIAGFVFFAIFLVSFGILIKDIGYNFLRKNNKPA